MSFGPKRGSIFTIFDNFARNFGMPIVVVVVSLISGNMMALLENSIILAIVLLNPIYWIVQYFNTYYSVDSDKFYVKSGIFNKKNLEIPLDRITTVDFTQNIILQLAGVYSIKVDNASSYGGNGEGIVRLALKKDEAESFRELLLSSNKAVCETEECVDDTDEPKNEVRLPSWKLLLMGALQSKGNAIVELFAILASLVGLINLLVGHDIGVGDKIVDYVFMISGALIAIIILLTFFIASTIIGAIYAFIKYYDFKIVNFDNAIHFEYGLFTRKKQTLLKEKITGFEYVQSLPMQFLKTGYLNAVAIGYSDLEEPEKVLIYPFIPESEIYDFMTNLVAEIERPKTEAMKAAKGSIRYFFLSPRCIFVAVLTAVMVIAERVFAISEVVPIDISWAWYLLAFIIVAVVISVFFEYKNTAVIAERVNVHFTAGGFTRIKTVVKTDMIESVSSTGSILKRKKGIVSVNIGILAPAMDRLKKVRNVPNEAFERIKKIIEF